MVLLLLLGIGSTLFLFRKPLIMLLVGFWVFVSVLGILYPS